MLERWLKREKIPAIYKPDLEKILSELGFLDEILKGSLICDVCKSKLTLENIRCLYMEDNKMKFCCINIECYQLVLSKRSTDKNG